MFKLNTKTNYCYIIEYTVSDNLEIIQVSLRMTYSRVMITFKKLFF